jgi:3-oxoacyl-[acyl-carrier-protein] synthase-3
MQTTLASIRIAGLAVTTGSVERDYVQDGMAAGLDRDALEKSSKVIGFRKRMIAAEGVTTLDLCADAATRLITRMGIDATSIDAIVFVTQSPDHSQPNNASLLHGRLGLSKTAPTFEISLGCSGWVFGLHHAALLCAHGGAARVLLCAGDTLSRITNPGDRATDSLFGDAGSATIVEKTENAEPFHFVLGADGNGARSIIVPAGGARQPASAATRVETVDAEGNRYHAENFRMNGAEVFNFTLREVPGAVNAAMKLAGWPPAEADALVLHQANRFIVSTVGRKCGFPAEKTPMNVFEKYGNQSSASLPCALIDGLTGRLESGPLKIVASGFGVGLSWGALAGVLGPLVIAPIKPYDLPRSSP